MICKLIHLISLNQNSVVFYACDCLVLKCVSSSVGNWGWTEVIR